MNRSITNRLARIEIAVLNYNNVSSRRKPPAKNRALLRSGILEAKRQLLTWTPTESDLIDLERAYGQYYVMNMRAIVRVYAPKESRLYETAKSLRTNNVVSVVQSSGQNMSIQVNINKEIIISEFILAYTVASIGLVSLVMSLVNRFLI